LNSFEQDRWIDYTRGAQGKERGKKIKTVLLIITDVCKGRKKQPLEMLFQRPVFIPAHYLLFLAAFFVAFFFAVFFFATFFFAAFFVTAFFTVFFAAFFVAFFVTAFFTTFFFAGFFLTAGAACCAGGAQLSTVSRPQQNTGSS
jgi:hypothetical protein